MMHGIFLVRSLFVLVLEDVVRNDRRDRREASDAAFSSLCMRFRVQPLS